MKAAVINRYGPAYSLKINEMPVPSVGDEEVLVKVMASSVNPVDWKIRQGKLQLITGFDFPLILGADFCGEVVETGKAAKEFKKGDKVFGMVKAVKGGAYAEYLLVKEKNIVLKPDSLNDEEAAAIPLAGMTALQGLRGSGQLEPDEKVLINGASGGVGTFAVQIAAAMGAQVTGVCSTKNMEMVSKLGAQNVVDYTKEEPLKPGNKYHLIFDTHGNLSFSKAKECLYDGGIFVNIAPSPKGILDLGVSKFTKHKNMELFMLRPQKEDLMDLKKLVEEGKLRSVIDRTYPLEELAEAHEYSEGGHVRGKIAIKIGSRS